MSGLFWADLQAEVYTDPEYARLHQQISAEVNEEDEDHG